ncbi:MAG: tRNA (adenosine(37)-N6)-threonylcarbamoyltransferase complex ATPase subunit type 1 TsaE [bacterium JZ-2024 1]
MSLRRARKDNSRFPPLLFYSRSAEETLALGKGLGKKIRGMAESLSGPRAVFLVTGPLGSGKTVFIKGLAKGLGSSPQRVRSPSFLTALFYPGNIPLLHIDMYRKDIPEKDLLGEMEDFTGVIAVEWGEKVKEFLFPDFVEVRIDFAVRKEERKILLQPSGEKSSALLGGFRFPRLRRE